MPASLRANLVIFKTMPSVMMRSLLLPIGVPSFIQVNEIGIGLAIACNKSSANTFPSVPTALYDGGGINFGGSMVKI